MAVCVGQVHINESARTAAEVSGCYPGGCYFETLGGLIGVSEQVRGCEGPIPVQATSIVLTVTLASLYLCLIIFEVNSEFSNKFPFPRPAILKKWL